MAVRPHEVMKERTEALEKAFYDLLAACDGYRTSVDELLAAERDADSPRDQLVHRLEQMSGRISRMITILEDDALTEMLPVVDRLFTLERAERGEDI
ncbi:MAG TPA: hypothetical protein VF148_07925 [Acidimicrobiia bacterium]